MRIKFGVDQKTGQPVYIDTQKIINPHLQLTGITGMGKTYTLQELVTSFVESAAELQKPVRVHVIDPHGDIDLPYCSLVKFSEATGYGYNPLEVNPDPDFGGVRRAIQKFIAAIKKHKTLGTKQEAVMRYLLEDLYRIHGFNADDPRTWIPDDPRTIRAIMQGKENRIYLTVAYEHRERFKALIRENKLHAHAGFDDFDNDPSLAQLKSWWIDEQYYDGDFLMWEPRKLFKTAPTLDDVVRFAERKLKAHYCGSNSAAIAHLTDVNLAARAYHRKVTDLNKRAASLDDPEKAELEKALEKAKEKASNAYNSYLDAIVSGRELDDIIRYNSQDVLTSVYERFQNLRAIGIYNPVPPPFEREKPIWQYRIKPLEIPVQTMFVDLLCARIFERSIQRGVQDDVVELIVIDEGKRFVGESSEDVVSKISNEARKFGLGLWIMGQTPGHFPDDFIKSTGTIIVLGLAKGDSNLAARKLGIDEALLGSVIPQKTALVQIKAKGSLSANFQTVLLS